MQVLKQQFKTKIKLNRAKPTQSPIICTKVIKTLPNEIGSAGRCVHCTYMNEFMISEKKNARQFLKVEAFTTPVSQWFSHKYLHKGSVV